MANHTQNFSVASHHVQSKSQSPSKATIFLGSSSTVQTQSHSLLSLQASLPFLEHIYTLLPQGLCTSSSPYLGRSFLRYPSGLHFHFFISPPFIPNPYFLAFCSWSTRHSSHSLSLDWCSLSTLYILHIYLFCYILLVSVTKMNASWNETFLKLLYPCL